MTSWKLSFASPRLHDSRIHRRIDRRTMFILPCCLFLFLSCTRLAAPQRAPSRVPFLNRRVLWLGDSITNIGDYVTFFEYYMERDYPRAKVDIISVGLASETASCLSEKHHPFPRPCVHERLGRALSAVKPNLVVACYGMNDGIYHPQSEERMKSFETGIHKLIDGVHDAGAGLILLTSPPFDHLSAPGLALPGATDFSFLTPFPSYDSVLLDYARWEIRLPAKDATVVDLHEPLLAYLQERRTRNPSFKMEVDGIHPTLLGQLLMARVILTRIGFTLPFAPLEAELARIQADPLYPLVKEQREGRSAAWLSYIGYTRSEHVKTDSVEEEEQIYTILQRRIDVLRTQDAPKH